LIAYLSLTCVTILLNLSLIVSIKLVVYAETGLEACRSFAPSLSFCLMKSWNSLPNLNSFRISKTF